MVMLVLVNVDGGVIFLITVKGVVQCCIKLGNVWEIYVKTMNLLFL